MAVRGRAAALRWLQNKKKEEKKTVVRHKPQSSVSSNNKQGNRGSGRGNSQSGNVPRRAQGYTSSAQRGRENRPSHRRELPQRRNQQSTASNYGSQNNRANTPTASYQRQRNTASTSAEMRNQREQNSGVQSRRNQSVSGMNQRMNRAATSKEMAEQKNRNTASTAANMRRQQEYEMMAEQRKQNLPSRREDKTSHKDYERANFERNEQVVEAGKKATKAITKAAKNFKNLDSTNYTQGIELEDDRDFGTDVAKSFKHGFKEAAISTRAAGERVWRNSLKSGRPMELSRQSGDWTESEEEKKFYKNQISKSELRQAGLREKIKEEQAKIHELESKQDSTLAKWTMGAASSSGGMVFDRLTGPMSLLTMGVRVTEGARGDVTDKADALKKEMLSSGNYSQEEVDELFKDVNKWDLANALGQGSIEALSEMTFGGIGVAAKYTPAGGILDKAVGKLAGRLGSSAVGRLGLGVSEEIAEEEIGNPLQTMWSNRIYGDKLQAMQEDSIRRAYSKEADTLEDNLATSENINSEEFLEQSKALYKKTGASDEEAEKLALMARDYFNARLEGDEKAEEDAMNKIVDTLAGGSNSLQEKWTMSDAANVAGSTAIMTTLTGLPSVMTTSQKGNEYRQNYGIQGVKNIAKVVENLDSQNSSKAKAVLESIENGKEPTGTQIYNLITWSNKAVNEAKDLEVARDRDVQARMKQEKLYAPIVDADYNLAPATEERFEDIVEKTIGTIKSLNLNMDEAEMYPLADVVAAYETGTITSEQLNELNIESPENRKAFESATGVNLNEYTVKDKKGNIDEAASNIEMHKALFAKSTENYMTSARIEQEAWNDEARVEMSNSLSSNMLSGGSVAVQNALKTVDPMDRGKFMLTGSAVRSVYEEARFRNTSWEDVSKTLKDRFPGVDKEVLHNVFNEAKTDRSMAEDANYGKQVKAGEPMDKKSLKDSAPVRVPGKVIDLRENPTNNLSSLSFITSAAKVFGVNIQLTDNLVAKDSKGNEVLDSKGNPLQVEGTQSGTTIFINTNEGILRAADDIAKHELIHQIRTNAPEEFKVFARLAMDRMHRANPEEFKKSIQSKQEQYKSVDENMTPEAAFEEMIANGSVSLDWEQLIADVQADNTIQNKSRLLEAIKNAVAEVLRKLRSLLSMDNAIDDEDVRTAVIDEIMQQQDVYDLLVRAASEAKANESAVAIDVKQDEMNGQNEKVGEDAAARLSISEQQDADYMKAVESGDMETAQRMVDEAAEKAMPNSILREGGVVSTGDTENGNLIKMYHGSGARGFTEFNLREGALGKGAYFSSSFEEATDYAIFASDDVKETDDWKYDWNDTEYDSIGEIGDALEEEGYIRAFYLDIRDRDDLDIEPGKVIAVAKTKSAIKSADPVTYDDEGNVIPLSQRFNTESNDVRFSMSEPVERVRDLVAVHNVKISDLPNMLELGGMPMPSIAVIKASMGHDKYGDISFLFHSDTIDPQKSRYNKVYGGDAYTPTFPAVRYKPNSKVIDRLKSLYYDNYKDLGGDKLRGLYRYSEGLEDELNSSGGEAALIERAKSDTSLMQSYLAIQGKPKVEDVYKTEETTLSDSQVEMHEMFIKELGEDAIRDVKTPEGENPIAHRKEWFKKYEKEIKTAYTKWLKESVGLDDETIQEVLDDQTTASYVKLFRETLKYLQDGATTTKETYDAKATNEAIENAAKETGFDAWVDETFKGVEAGKGIRNNKDMFTNMGNRRSWDTLHDPVTLENVVAIMRSELDAGSNGFLGANPKGAAQKSYSSLDEIVADEDRLEMLSDEEYSAKSDEALTLFTDVCASIVESNPQRFENSFVANLDVGEIVAEVLNETRNKDKMHKLLNRDYGMTVSDEQMDKLYEAIESISEVPTGYFEAKPKRAVGFDEVRAALVPNNMDKDLEKQLADKGVEIVEYDPEVEGDRTSKLNEVADAQQLKFSLSPEQRKLDDDYMAAVESNNMEEAQRLVEEAAKSAGYNSPKVYHGSPVEYNFTTFVPNAFLTEEEGDNQIKGYFSEDRSYSENYGDVREFYVRINNPFEFSEKEKDKTIEEWVKWFESKGVPDVKLDSAIEKDSLKGADYGDGRRVFGVWEIFDSGAYWNGDGNLTTKIKEAGFDGLKWDYGEKAWIPFDDTAIKSADTVTYAEDGSVIPLSERFNPESNDIRYSMPTQDVDGNILTDGQMEYFKNSQARDEQGRLVPVFHSTNSGGFTIFDPLFSDDKRSLFFTSNRRMSESYARDTGDIQLGKDLPVPDEIWSVEELAKYCDKMDDVAGEAGAKVIIWNVDDDTDLFSNFNYYGERPIAEFAEEYPEFDENNIAYEIYDELTGELLAEGLGLAELSGELVDSINYINKSDRFSTTAGTYTCYLNLENPMIIDCKGRNWDSIIGDGFEELQISYDGESFYVDGTSIPWTLDEIRDQYGEGFADAAEEWVEKSSAEELEEGNTIFTWDGASFDPEVEGYWPTEENTRYWCNEADAMGYDGVIFLNLRDNGPHGYGGEIGDVYVAFSSNQVKDVNNQNPTENPDIRYSIVDEDEVKARQDRQFAYDNSYEALMHYEKMFTSEDASEEYDLLNDKDVEAYYRKAKRFVEKDVDAFYSGLTPVADRVVTDDPVLEEGRVRMARSKEDFFNSNIAKWNDRWLTDGTVLDVESVKKEVRDLVMAMMQNSDTDRQYKTGLVNKTLIDMRLAYDYAKRGQTDIASAILWHSAQKMIDNVEFYREDDSYATYKDLRDYLRTTKIALGNEYWSDVAGGEFGRFRKKNYGRLKLVKGSTNVDQIYQELEERWPEWFNTEEQMTPPDMLEQISHVLDVLQPVKEAYSSEEAAEVTQYIAEQLTDIMDAGKELHSLADDYKKRLDEKTKAMKLRHEEAMRKVREQRDKGIKAEKAKWQVKEEKRKERASHKKAFASIEKSYKTLTDRLFNNTADSHIPQQYKKELAGLLACFDMQTEGSKKREARTGHVAQKTIKLSAIKTALSSIENNTQLFHVNDAITDIIDELLGIKNGSPSESIDGLTIDELSVTELAKVDKLLKALVHEFNNYEKVRVGTKKQQAADIGKAQVDSALEHAKTFGSGKDYQNLPGFLDNIINLDEVTPAYMFRRIDPDNNGLGLMWKEVRRSFDKYVKNQNQLNEWIDDIVGEYHDNPYFFGKYGAGELADWRSERYAKTFRLVKSNGSVTLTPAQMMSIYCLSKRAQAMDHMTGAGIVVAPVSYNAKKLRDVKKRANTALPVPLTEADIQEIISELTPEQIKVAEELQELLSTKMAQWGNEASMDVIGIELFNEKDYFPIKSDKAALTKDLNEAEFAEAIRNFGFTKAVQPGARNAIMVDDIFDVVTEHCNNMNLYNSYSATINDFMKVYNYRDFREDGTEYTVQQAIAHAYSKKATTFIMTFIRDLNGNVSGRASGIEKIYNDLLANAKKASVFANLRVAAQQPTAIARAFAEISPKYIKGIKIEKGAMEEMFEHAPIALWKSWGYYDINMGKSIEDIMMNEGKIIEDLATDLYGALDNVTWTAIWQMVKNEMKDTHPDVEVGTDEYWELCNERFSEIIDLTQVVDSPMHRSHAMRDKGFFHKMTTSFMAEPTVTFNMMKAGYVNAWEQYKLGNTKEATKIFARTNAVILLQAAAVSAAAGFVDALRGKGADDDDDDDEKSKLRRILALWEQNTFENFIDELKPYNKIYVVKDIASMFEGWDNRNLALQGFQLVSLGVRQVMGDSYARSSKSWYENLFGGLGYLSGIPVKTMMTGLENAMGLFGVSIPAIDNTKDRLDKIAELNKEKRKESGEEGGYFSQLFSMVMSDEKTEASASTDTDSDTDTDSGSGSGSKGGMSVSYEDDAQALYDASREYDDMLADAQKAADGYEGEDRNKRIWQSVSKDYKKYMEIGDIGYLEQMRDVVEEMGGDLEYFDERMISTAKSTLKKSLSYESGDADLQARIGSSEYLRMRGVTEEEISEVCYKSEMAKDVKVAFRLGDEQLIQESAQPLVDAGLTDADWEKLWKNRNRLDIKKYDGKYKDQLKSQGTFIWPTQGTITSHFGRRNAPTAGASSNHPAIDIGAATGTPVVASDGGVVISAGKNGGYGNSVGIKHDNGMVTYYNHLYGWNVKEGDVVAQGQQIGQVGSTGVSTGPHLDFKILDINGNAVDPEEYLQ